MSFTRLVISKEEPDSVHAVDSVELNTKQRRVPLSLPNLPNIGKKLSAISCQGRHFAMGVSIDERASKLGFVGSIASPLLLRQFLGQVRTILNGAYEFWSSGISHHGLADGNSIVSTGQVSPHSCFTLNASSSGSIGARKKSSQFDCVLRMELLSDAIKQSHPLQLLSQVSVGLSTTISFMITAATGDTFRIDRADAINSGNVPSVARIVRIHHNCTGTRYQCSIVSWRSCLDLSSLLAFSMLGQSFLEQMCLPALDVSFRVVIVSVHHFLDSEDPHPMVPDLLFLPQQQNCRSLFDRSIGSQRLIGGSFGSTTRSDILTD